MDADGLPLVGPGLDYTKIEAINQKRIIAFVNHFVSHTVQFLNHFAIVCEEKLGDINIRIQQLEATTSILESKLSYIPGLENVTAPTTATVRNDPAEAASVQTSTDPSPPAPVPVEQQNGDVELEKVADAAPENTVKDDPRYAKFFKLLQVKVPPGAIKQKMVLEGLNPDLLDTPNAPAPPPGTNAAESDSMSEPEESASEEDW